MNAIATRGPDASIRAGAVERGSRAAWLVIAAFVLLGAAVKAPQLLAPMGQDQGLYHTVGQEILRGAVPYRDAWDPKPPAIFYTNAALLAWLPDPWRACHLGSVPGLSQSDLQPRCGTLLFEVVDFVNSVVVAAVVAALARRLGLLPMQAALAFGLTVIFVNLAILDPEGSTPEKYALGPAVGVLLAGLAAVRSGHRRWLIVAGALASLAALYKQPDLASFGALSVWLLSLRRGRDLVWLWAPLLSILGGVWLAFVLAGAASQFVDATLTYNLGRFSFQSDRIPLKAIASTWQIFRDGLAPLLLLGALGALFAWRSHAYLLLLLWTGCDVLALGLGGTKFTREYFVQLVPSFAILAAIGLQLLWTALRQSAIGRTWVALSLATIVLLTGTFQANFTLRIWNEYVARAWTTTSVEHLAAMTHSLPPEEGVFVWGDEAEIYALSDRLPTTRFLNTAALIATGDPASQRRRAEVIALLVAAPPAIIVVDRRTSDDDPNGQLQLNVNAFPELKQLLVDHYRQMDPAILGAYLGGDRELIYVRQGNPDLCARMPGCRLS